jgi:hypothetical protein
VAGVGRAAWAFFVAMAVLFLLFGLGDIVQGGSNFITGEAVLFHAFSGTTWAELKRADPGAARLIDYLVRIGGMGLVVTSLFTLAIAATALRRGERWAWLAMWVWPAFFATYIALVYSLERVPGSGTPVPVISGSVIGVLSVAVLVLSYRRYFGTT